MLPIGAASKDDSSSSFESGEHKSPGGTISISQSLSSFIFLWYSILLILF